MQSRHVPHDLEINISIIMRHDVAHAAHPSEGKLRNGLTGLPTEVDCCFADNFDPANDCVLFFRVSLKIRFRYVLDLTRDPLCRVKNVTKAPELVSFHRLGWLMPGYVHAQKGSWTFPRIAATQNPLVRPPTPRLLPPSPEGLRSMWDWIHPRSPAGLHHYARSNHLVQPNQTRPTGGYGASHRTEETTVAFRIPKEDVSGKACSLEYRRSEKHRLLRAPGSHRICCNNWQTRHGRTTDPFANPRYTDRRQRVRADHANERRKCDSSTFRTLVRRCGFRHLPFALRHPFIRISNWRTPK